MKYLLSILCLFIFSCDSGGDDTDAIFMLGENFSMPMSLNKSWAYDFTDSMIFQSLDGGFQNIYLIEGTLSRMVVDNIDSEYDVDLNCTYIIEENLSSNVIVNTFDSLEYNNEEGLIKPYVDSDGFYYSFYFDDNDIFESCGSFSQDSEEDNQSESNEDVLHPYIPSLISFFNALKIEYPLYLGKIWVDNTHEVLGPVQYEIVSQENIILGVNDSLNLFECYKIVVDWYAGITIEYYLSSEGIVKVLVSTPVIPSTHPGSPSGSLHNEVELILTDF